jgi:hypothetical protein
MEEFYEDHHNYYGLVESSSSEIQQQLDHHQVVGNIRLVALSKWRDFPVERGVVNQRPVFYNHGIYS